MKNFYFLSIIITLFFNTNVFAQQITTDSSIPLEQLILNNLTQGCVEISNISSNINGSINNLESYGYFEKGSSTFPFENGIVLSTGNVNSAGNTIKSATLNEGEENWGTDADLENALGIINTLNATTIEFDFVSFSNQIQFNYLLASEEYYLTNPCSYSDGFAFLIKEAGTIDPYENIALIPGTNTDNRYKFNLSNQNHQILGAQSPNEFTVTYYASDEDANSKENNHDDFYEIDTEEKLFARIENNQTGCYSITSFMAYVRRKPVNDIGDQVICLENFPLMVTIDTGFEEDTYAWEPFGQTTADIVIEEIGEYSATVTTKYGCSTTKTFNVIESEQANIEFTETVDFSDPNNITITVSGIGDYLYQLDDREPQISNFFQNVPIGPRLITVIDINGCTSISKEVVVIDTPKFLTPNNDGYFDTWHITGVEQLEGTIIHIYDQYGKLIKSLAHNSPGWDGTYNGHHMPSNDYWFAAHVYYKGDEFDVKGHFTLKR